MPRPRKQTNSPDSCKVILRNTLDHPMQERIRQSAAKRKIIRAGRRGGKTVIAATMDTEAFLKGKRCLYATPTAEQLGKYWYEVCRALNEPISCGIYHKNETEHTITRPGTENRIKGKTAWNANTLRGDYADRLTLDEWQLMAEDTWEEVGAPMLLDNNGDAVFIYTPPSIRSSGTSKARDPRHASKMFKKAQSDKSGRWEAFHFRSMDNPYISKEALVEITLDMSVTAYKQEILAEDDDDAWTGLIYKGFNQQTQVIRRFPVPANWLIYTGHDFGGANPAAIFLAADPATGYFYIFQEYSPGPGFTTDQHVQEFKKVAADYNVIKRAGGSHQEEEIRVAYRAHGWNILEPKIRDVLAAIDRVQTLMEKNKLFIFEDCYQILFQINNYSWKLDEQGQPTNDIQDKARFHLLDALRYIASDFTPETVRRTEARSYSYLAPGSW